MGVRDVIAKQGVQAISSDRLATVTVDDIRTFFGVSGPVPLEAERVRVVQEVRCYLDNSNAASFLVDSAAPVPLEVERKKLVSG